MRGLGAGLPLRRLLQPLSLLTRSSSFFLLSFFLPDDPDVVSAHYHGNGYCGLDKLHSDFILVLVDSRNPRFLALEGACYKLNQVPSVDFAYDGLGLKRLLEVAYLYHACGIQVTSFLQQEALGL